MIHGVFSDYNGIKKLKKGKKKSSKHLKTKYHIKKIHEPNKSQEKF